MNEISWLWAKDQRRMLFEADYWGNSSYMAIKYLLDTNPEINLNVRFLGCPGENNWWILSDQEKNRFHVVNNIEDADFMITNFRTHPEYYYEYGEPIHTLKAYNSVISAIYKISKD
ncbi:hypothetical protein VCSRO55_2320 [Vibrio cholerae]|uniref:hypothetical protein n=1 Tax=Vibrio cholerae TaxID=666 RepID=UPI0011D93647|nr:hypothetical protein [Vibrio cholerae]EGR2496923.1 hypothetical protein [Vibrio cholerae]TXZ49448.1 hypothetical protein FXE54_17765 [Vibrio cholerae]GHW26130.1 hypothetical protein VCSRO55_2320 [Vibrio cholerae]